MHKFCSKKAVIAVLIALGTACSDDQSLTAPTPPPDESGTGEPPSSVATRPRFELDLQAGGALRPGVPIQLVLTATGTTGTADAEFEIVVPEVAAAERSGWANYRPIIGARIPAAASRRAGLGRGARMVVQQTVTFPVPGYYTVVASARAIDNDSFPDVEDGELLQDEAHVVMYLLVDERGGRISRTLDLRTLPATSATRLGPLMERTGVTAPPATLARPPRTRRHNSASVSLVPTPASEPGLQTGSSLRMVVRYQNLSTSTYTAVGGADFELHLYDSNFSYVNTRYGSLSADGAVSIGCGEAYYAELGVYAYNHRAAVGTDPTTFRSGGEIGYFPVYPGSDCSRGTIDVTADPVPSHVYVLLNRIAAGAQAHFGRSRPQMPAVLTSDISNIKYSTYCANATFESCSGYGGDDFLRLITDPNTSYKDQIWGENGTYIIAHEYGHAFHEKALGGFIRYYGGCTKGHSLTTLGSSMKCILPEGVANYFAVAVLPDETGYDNAWETNHYHNTYLAGTDGSRSEGAIAAFLYDLTDNNRWAYYHPEPFDIVQYTGALVGNVIAGCQVYQSGSWILNNGIDHLTYCFENRVDPVVTSNAKYFPTRSPDPTGQSGGSTATAPDEVRKIWRRNLYGE